MIFLTKKEMPQNVKEKLKKEERQSIMERKKERLNERYLQRWSCNQKDDDGLDDKKFCQIE